MGYHAAPPIPQKITTDMQLIADFLPLLFFLGAYLYGDLYLAVKVLMVAMPMGLALKTYATRKLDKVYLGSTIFLLVMGTATILLRNPSFLYWKPTAFYWVLAIVFLGSQWVGNKTIAERMFSKVGELPAEKWRALNLAWSIFFAIAGVLNIYVAYSYSEAFWVNFKVFGLTAITFLFAIAQAIWMARTMRDPDTANEHIEAD